MKLKLTLVLLTVFAVSHLYSQNEDTINQSEKLLKPYSKIDFSFSGLGLSLDAPLSNKVLLEFAVGAGAGYRVDEDFRYRMYFDSPAVYASVHGKYYYNQEDRLRRSRPLSFNAGNFFGVKAKYTTPNLADEAKTWHTMLVAFHWGMQRKMGRHFLYQLTIGVGGAVDLEDKTTTHVTLYPDFNFRVSYVLPFGK